MITNFLKKLLCFRCKTPLLIIDKDFDELSKGHQEHLTLLNAKEYLATKCAKCGYEFPLITRKYRSKKEA